MARPRTPPRWWPDGTAGPGALLHPERKSKGVTPMGIRMNPSLELHAPSGRSPGVVPTRVRAGVRAGVRVLSIQAILALGLVSSASAGLITPEEGEAQL